jgi:hypothetical protein
MAWQSEPDGIAAAASVKSDHIDMEAVDASSWLTRLADSSWLGHVNLLLRSSLEVALVVRDGGHALIHCR